MYDVKKLKHRLLRFLELAAAGLVLLPAAPGALAPAYAQSSTTDVQVNVCYPPSAPSISAPSDGEETEDSSIVMTGTATPGNFVYAVRNGVEVGYVTAAGDGSYSISVALVVGENVLKAREKNVCGAAVDSATSVTVVRTSVSPPNPPTPDNPPSSNRRPSLGIPGAGVPQLRPPDNTKPGELEEVPVITTFIGCFNTSDSKIVISGEAKPLTVVSLYLNSKQIAAVESNESGNFVISVPLARGENRVIAVADQLQSKVLTICYEPEETRGIRQFLPSLAIGVIIGLMVALYLLVSRGLLKRLLVWLAAFKRRS